MENLSEFHSCWDGVRWRLVPAGVEIEGSGVERTRGEPTTVTRVWNTWAKEINACAIQYRVPTLLIVATICTESAGKADAVREEPGYKSDDKTPGRVSAGLMQTLLSTAQETLHRPVDRQWLLEPANSIEAGTAYIAQQVRETNLDPPLVAAAYNAGDLYHNTGSQNRWKLRQYPFGTGQHCDRFVRFFNDAVFVLGRSATKPAVTYKVMGGGTGPAPRTSPPAPPSPLALARGDKSLSGPEWVKQFPGSVSVEALDAAFRDKVKRFLAALQAAGANVNIVSTYRPYQRSYMMHYAWRIANKDPEIDVRNVPAYAGKGDPVNINWWHGSEEPSRQAAAEMVKGFHIDLTNKVAPALTSRHNTREAIDMEITWTSSLSIARADGSVARITSAPLSSLNPDLIAVAETYGVKHFHNAPKDKNHWSTDGH